MHNETQDSTSATIISFPRKRGRPRSALRGIDRGTPELLRKRRRGETIEMLDLCLQREWISTRQHWCGIHLRWLFTLRYGAPGIRAMDPAHTGGYELKTDDPAWRQEREQEYVDAIQALRGSGHALLVMNVCIYNEKPRWFSDTDADTRAVGDFKTQLNEGLEVLSRLWP